MFRKSGFFTGSFQAALYSFAGLRRNKGFLLAESPFFSLSQQKKRTAKKNRFFGACKPANYRFYFIVMLVTKKLKKKTTTFLNRDNFGSCKLTTNLIKLMEV